MSIYRALEKLELAIMNSRRLIWPFGKYILLDRDKVLNFLDGVRASLPEEIKQARWITKEKEKQLKEAREKRDAMIAEADVKAGEILQKARDDAARMVAESEIVGLARAKAEDMLRNAEEKATYTLEEADKRATSMVRDAENTRNRTLAQVEKETDEVRRSAQDFAYRIFDNMEKEFGRILGVLQKGKQQVTPGSKE